MDSNPTVSMKIEQEVVLVRNILEMANAERKRIANLPYFILRDDGTLWFEVLTEKTDAKILLNQIKNKRIWKLKQHCTSITPAGKN